MVFRTHNPNNLFDLDVSQFKDYSYIRMEMLKPVFSTKNLPATYEFLKRHLPSIFDSKCFNKNKYPFTKEVKATQIAHLFEHILLEYLSASKRQNREKNFVHNGITKWNWEKDQMGVFHIDIDVGVTDNVYFQNALTKSSALLVALLNIN